LAKKSIYVLQHGKWKLSPTKKFSSGVSVCGRTPEGVKLIKADKPAIFPKLYFLADLDICSCKVELQENDNFGEQ